MNMKQRQIARCSKGNIEPQHIINAAFHTTLTAVVKIND